MAKDVSQVRHEVVLARQEVAYAVEALAYKLNAPKRLKERVATKVRTAKAQTTAKAIDAKEQVTSRLGDHSENGGVTIVETPPSVEPRDEAVPTKAAAGRLS